MTREDIDNIISTICPNDEDSEKPCISPAFLKKELEALALEQEPCEDTISRQAVLAVLYEWRNNTEDFPPLIARLKRLPSVELKRQTGHWIGRDVSSTNFYGKCSKCGLEFQVDAWYTQNMNYCPNCGCRMIEPQESEVNK